MQQHYEETAVEYEAHVSRGFVTLPASMYTMAAGETIRPFRTPVEDRLLMRGMLFGGFKKCQFDAQRFDADPERRFAVVLENDAAVMKWFKPGKAVFKIHYGHEATEYESDFVVETETAKFLCEPKRENQMRDPEVLAKAEAAATWCHHASA